MRLSRRKLFLMASTALGARACPAAASCGLEEFNAITDPVFDRVKKGVVKAVFQGVATGIVLSVGVSLILPAAGLGTLAFGAGMAIGGGAEILRMVNDSSKSVAGVVEAFE